MICADVGSDGTTIAFTFGVSLDDTEVTQLTDEGNDGSVEGAVVGSSFEIQQSTDGGVDSVDAEDVSDEGLNCDFFIS